MQELLIMFISMGVISAVLIACLFIIQRPKSQLVTFYTAAIFSVVIGFVSFTSFPDNFMLQRFLATIFTLLSPLSLFMFLKFPTKTNLSKIILSLSMVLNLALIFVK